MLKYLMVFALLALSSGAALADEARRLSLEAAALVVQAESMDDRKKRHAALEDARDKVSEIAERFPDAFSDMHVQLYRYGKRTRMSMSDLSELIEEQLPPPPCTGDSSKTPRGYCLMELSNISGCHMLAGKAVVTAAWSGECRDGVPTGTGKRRVVSESGFVWVSEGSYVDGRRNGVWLEVHGATASEGAYHEGSYVDGRRSGVWVIAENDGTVDETTFVGGRGNASQIHVEPGGTVREVTYVDFRRHGVWIDVEPDGTVRETAYVDGEADGWIEVEPDGTVKKGEYRSDGTSKEGMTRVNVKSKKLYSISLSGKFYERNVQVYPAAYRALTEEGERLISKKAALVEKSKELLRKGAVLAEKGKRLAGDL